MDSSNFFRIFRADWNPNTLISFCWYFRRECQAVQRAVSKFPAEWIASWCCFSHRQCQTNSSLQHSRQNVNQTEYMSKIDNLKWWQFTHRTCWNVWWGPTCGVSAVYKLSANIYKLDGQQQQSIYPSEMTIAYMNDGNLKELLLGKRTFYIAQLKTRWPPGQQDFFSWLPEFQQHPYNYLQIIGVR